MSRATRYRARYVDPDGDRYGIPTYPWRSAPAGLATRRQLAADGLRPGVREPVAQVMWRQWRRDAVALLWPVDSAQPKREPSPAQLRALGRALAARRTCPTCRRDVGYCLPRSGPYAGLCVECADPELTGSGSAGCPRVAA